MRGKGGHVFHSLGWGKTVWVGARTLLQSGVLQPSMSQIERLPSEFANDVPEGLTTLRKAVIHTGML